MSLNRTNDPHANNDDTKNKTSLASISVLRGGIASSGSYERYIELEGKRYCHLISPHTGKPIDSMVAVSVLADQCVIAGSISTIAMLKDKEGPAWLEQVGVAHVWMDNEGNTGGSGIN